MRIKSTLQIMRAEFFVFCRRPQTAEYSILNIILYATHEACNPRITFNLHFFAICIANRCENYVYGLTLQRENKGEKNVEKICAL